MTIMELAKLESDAAYKELLDSFDGVSEQLAWSVVTLQPGEYMHAEGSIISTVAHIAGCKFIYGSAAYRGLDIRFRDIVERLEKIWPSWQGMKDYLQESQDYWRASWAGETDMERIVKSFRDRDWPSWKVIWTMSHHDSYHAGQIQLLRSSLAPSETPPQNEGDNWRSACKDLPSW